MAADLDGLEQVLGEIDAWFIEHRPDLLPRLRPGLTESEIADRAAELTPFHLPADLITLYGWHNGFDGWAEGDFVPFLHDADFNSLDEAIAEYRSWMEMAQQVDVIVWHPAWFPAFGRQSGGLVALQLQPERPAGVVWGYHDDGGELLSENDSVAALFRTSLALWKAGEIQNVVFITEGIWAALATHNPRTRNADGRWAFVVDPESLEGWPDEWTEAGQAWIEAGRSQGDFVPWEASDEAGG